ncbi:Rab-3-interacting molecule unc-10 [Melipona quadrifasciata]|uniref:Rab-3-interacting molecule unc-10 n=1 Tax=Melipona quadrifasciata TaxID=166423 RepID=A0A0M9A8C6_9HYME|nr:Rab-3-interacting molecule unc-10 [Melipona quadrifasciata]
MAAVPDMSHLTPEERSTIEEVIIRQKQEEEKENEIMRRKQDEVKILEERIRACSEKHKKAGVELHATCHICLKTKFADGVGHICNYCSIRCCARCGGKVTLRSNKVGGRDREKETAEIYRPGENRVLRAGTNSHCFSCSFAFSRPDTLREIP